MGIVIIMGHFGSLGILQPTCSHGGAAFSGIPRMGRDHSWRKAVFVFAAGGPVWKGLRHGCVDAPIHRAGVNLRAA
jgi:hypothetical protein